MGPYGVPGSLSMGPYGVPGSRDSWTRGLGSRGLLGMPLGASRVESEYDESFPVGAKQKTWAHFVANLLPKQIRNEVFSYMFYICSKLLSCAT